MHMVQAAGVAYSMLRQALRIALGPRVWHHYMQCLVSQGLSLTAVCPALSV